MMEIWKKRLAACWRGGFSHGSHRGEKNGRGGKVDCVQDGLRRLQMLEMEERVNPQRGLRRLAAAEKWGLKEKAALRAGSFKSGFPIQHQV